MQDNVLNNYVLERLKSTAHNISRYSKSRKPEYLHKMRVDIKNIKAVYSFARKVFKRNYRAAELGELFKEAGKIRETQINIRLLGFFPDPPKSLIAQLRKEEQNLNEEFDKNRSRHINALEEFRKNVRFPKRLAGLRKIRKYFERLKEQSAKLVLNRNREGLHKYRMKLKQMIYVYDLLPKRVQKEIELNAAMITKQQEELGNWHDTYSAINSFSEENCPHLKAEYLQKLKDKEARQFRKALRYLEGKRKS